MTKAKDEYDAKMKIYQKAISEKKRLLMILRSNTPKGLLGEKKKKVEDKIQKAEKKLSELFIPTKPAKPFGYEVYINGGYEFFSPSESKQEAIEQATESGAKLTEIKLKKKNLLH